MTYENNAQQRLLAVIEVLGANPIEGIAASDVAKTIGTSQPQAFRALKNLEIAKWAEQLPSGNWRLGPRATLLSESFRLALVAYHHRYLTPDSASVDQFDLPEPRDGSQH